MAKEDNTEKTHSINRVMAELNKQFGETVISKASDTPHVPRISTGIPILDEATGGGFPLGRLIELYGLQSTGKSLISLMTIAQAQKQGLTCIYIDAEGTFDAEWAQQFGIDVDKLIVSPLAIGEDVFKLMFKLLQAEPGVIVLDSIAALITRKEMEEDVDKAFMAPKARLMSKGLAMLNALNKKTCIIFINQLRATMALYGPVWATTGGNALRFYSSVRIEVKKTEDLHEEDKKTKPIIGQIVGFKVAKNKTSTPNKIGSFKYYYNGTIQ